MGLILQRTISSETQVRQISFDKTNRTLVGKNKYQRIQSGMGRRNGRSRTDQTLKTANRDDLCRFKFTETSGKIRSGKR